MQAGKGSLFEEISMNCGFEINMTQTAVTSAVSLYGAIEAETAT